MNHYKSCSGNITTRSGSDNSIDNKEDDTPIGLIIQFLNAESCAFTEASLACSSLTPIVCVPILLIGCAHVEAPHINRALAPTLCAPAPSTTPHLGYIGVPNPPRGRSSTSDDNGDGSSHWEQEAVAAAEAYIMPPPPGTGNLLIDVDEEQDEEKLPVLSSIWDCPMINKFAGFDDNGKALSGWICGWCPLENDGSSPKPFKTMNATKALAHVTRVGGYDIRPCCGHIPASRQTLTKEHRNSKRDTMGNSIADIQDRTVLALAEGAKKSSRHAL